MEIELHESGTAVAVARGEVGPSKLGLVAHGHGFAIGCDGCIVRTSGRHGDATYEDVGVLDVLDLQRFPALF